MSDLVFERLVEFQPAFDRRNPDPAKDYGIHGVELRMVLKGPQGAVQFLLYTNWQLPHVTEQTLTTCLTTRQNRISLQTHFLPIPADLGYHWCTPHYKDQPLRECPYVAGGQCYYDGSGLNAERIYQVLVSEGDAGFGESWKVITGQWHKSPHETHGS